MFIEDDNGIIWYIKNEIILKGLYYTIYSCYSVKGEAKVKVIDKDFYNEYKANEIVEKYKENFCKYYNLKYLPVLTCLGRKKTDKVYIFLPKYPSISELSFKINLNEIGIQMTYALEFLHNKGIFGFFKIGNVLFSKKERFYLSNYGFTETDPLVDIRMLLQFIRPIIKMQERNILNIKTARRVRDVIQKIKFFE